MIDLYEQGRWAFALTLIDHLPRTSAYSHAVAQDEEYAELVAELAPGLSGPREVPFTEWSPETEALAAVVNRLAEVVNAITASAGGKPRPVKPYPHPVSAADRLRTRRYREAAAELEAALFPDLH